MNSHFVIKNLQQAMDYHEHCMDNSVSLSGGGYGDYLQSGSDSKMVWGGDLAEKLGLAGQAVDRAKFQEIYSGKHANPITGEIETIGRKERRFGIDVTFTPHKSFSVAALVGGDDRLIKLFEEAVKLNNDLAERDANSYRVTVDGVTTVVRSDHGLLYSSAIHLTDREEMPNLHAHVLWANEVIDKNGNMISLDSTELVRGCYERNLVVNAFLASRLEELGYTITMDKDGNAKINEFDTYAKETSKRTERAHAYLRARNIDPELATKKQINEAFDKTRSAKDLTKTHSENMTEWKGIGTKIGVDAEKVVAEAKARAEQIHLDPVNQARNAYGAVQKAVEHLSERSSAFTLKDLEKEAIRFNGGKANFESLMDAIEAKQKSGELVDRLVGEDGKKGYTTAEAIKLEKDVLTMIEEGMGSLKAIMADESLIDKHIQEFNLMKQKEKGDPTWKLTDEQINATKNILMSENLVAAIQGDAGTGKTAGLEFVKHVADIAGIHMIGQSPTGKAAAGLGVETGMNSNTVAAFLIDIQRTAKDLEKDISNLEKKLEKVLSGGRAYSDTASPDGRKTLLTSDQILRDLDSKRVQLKNFQEKGTLDGKSLRILVDEAGLVDTKTASKLLKYVSSLKDAGIYWMGDTKQLSSPSAGNFFKQLQQIKGVVTSHIVNARRFLNALQPVKDSIEFFKQGQYLSSLMVLNPIEVAPVDFHLAVAKIFIDEKDRINSDPAFKDKDVSFVSGTNKDRNFINLEIRQILQGRGDLGGQNFEKEIHVDPKMTAAEKKTAGAWKEFNIECVIAERDLTRKYGIPKDAELKVIGIYPEKNRIEIQKSDGTTVMFNPERVTNFRPVQVEKREFSVGDSVQARAPIGASKITDASGKRIDNPERIVNGAIGTITKIDANGATVEWKTAGGSKIEKSLANDDLKKVDYGYGRTTLQEQGASVVSEIVAISSAAAKAFKQASQYVSSTRAKIQTIVVTDCLKKLQRLVGAKDHIETAIDMKKEQADRAVAQANPNGAQASQQPNPEVVNAATNQMPAQTAANGIQQAPVVLHEPQHDAQSTYDVELKKMQTDLGHSQSKLENLEREIDALREKNTPHQNPNFEKAPKGKKLSLMGAIRTLVRGPRKEYIQHQANVRSLGIGGTKDRYMINKKTGEVFRANAGYTNIKNWIALSEHEKAGERISARRDVEMKKLIERARSFDGRQLNPSEMKERDKAWDKVRSGKVDMSLADQLRDIGDRGHRNLMKDSITWTKCKGIESMIIRKQAKFKKPPSRFVRSSKFILSIPKKVLFDAPKAIHQSLSLTTISNYDNSRIYSKVSNRNWFGHGGGTVVEVNPHLKNQTITEIQDRTISRDASLSSKEAEVTSLRDDISKKEEKIKDFIDKKPAPNVNQQPSQSNVQQPNAAPAPAAGGQQQNTPTSSVQGSSTSQQTTDQTQQKPGPSFETSNVTEPSKDEKVKPSQGKESATEKTPGQEKVPSKEDKTAESAPSEQKDGPANETGQTVKPKSNDKEKTSALEDKKELGQKSGNDKVISKEEKFIEPSTDPKVKIEPSTQNQEAKEKPLVIEGFGSEPQWVKDEFKLMEERYGTKTPPTEKGEPIAPEKTNQPTDMKEPVKPTALTSGVTEIQSGMDKMKAVENQPVISDGKSLQAKTETVKPKANGTTVKTNDKVIPSPKNDLLKPKENQKPTELAHDGKEIAKKVDAKDKSREVELPLSQLEKDVGAPVKDRSKSLGR